MSEDVGRKCGLLYTAGGSINLYNLLLKSSWQYLVYVKVLIPNDWAGLHLEVYPRDSHVVYSEVWSTIFTEVLFVMENLRTKEFINRKKIVVCVYYEITHSSYYEPAINLPIWVSIRNIALCGKYGLK